MIEIDDKRFFTDSKMLKVIRNLKERMVIVKPDKGQGVVLIKNIFGDESKFRKVDRDPTHTRIGTTKTYINTMMNRGEITENEKQLMRPKGAVRARARGMPKTHKPFDLLPSFRPVIDTMNTPYNGIGQFLTNILHPLTQNEFAMKDSFQAAQEIGKIDFSLFKKGYRLVSFDVVSLFTNVPLKRTINVILKRIYTEKLVNVKLRKSTMKKLIHDCCTKTTFSFNDQLYEQIDGVCMGSSLGPTIANIIMTELEKEILPKLIETGIIKSYIRYVDDTLVMIKNEDIEKVLKRFNAFDENLKFTVDKFEDSVIHFLDILIDKNGNTDIYTKPTNTGQYTNFDSYVPWRYKTSWAYALYVRTMKLCSSAASKSKQITRINILLSWNGFPKYVRSKLIKKFKIDYVYSLTKTR